MIISFLLTPKNARKPKKGHNSLKFETLLVFFPFSISRSSFWAQTRWRSGVVKHNIEHLNSC